jgi:4-diphosphocytidyl-2C-methyl-D-erythritol kinase
LLASAEKTHDRRLARLLGSDKPIFARQNSGFASPHGEQWAEWTQEDEAYAAEAHTVDDTARQVRRELPL